MDVAHAEQSQEHFPEWLKLSTCTVQVENEALLMRKTTVYSVGNSPRTRMKSRCSRSRLDRLDRLRSIVICQ